MEVKISPTDLIRSGFKVRVETPKGLHTDYDNKWVIKMSEKSNTGYGQLRLFTDLDQRSARLLRRSAYECGRRIAGL